MGHLVPGQCDPGRHCNEVTRIRERHRNGVPASDGGLPRWVAPCVGRGLKYQHGHVRGGVPEVAPCVGAWVEMTWMPMLKSTVKRQ